MNRIRIAQQFGSSIGGELRERLPNCDIADVPMGPDGWDLECEVLLSGPSKSWQDRTRPAGWPGRLQWIQLPSSGIDAYPQWLFEAPLVTTAQGLNASSIAEFVFALMLAREKRFPDTWISKREDWKPRTLGTLRGKTLGLAGIGAVGSVIARHALGFGMQVVAFRRAAARPMEGVAVVNDFISLASQADHLVLCLPYTPETRHMVNSDFLARCKPGVHIVNVARGGLIDQDALLAMLDADITASASLDVTEPEPLVDAHPLYRHPRVWLSPHVAWSAPDTLQRLLDLFLEQFGRYTAGQVPRFCVERTAYHNTKN